MNCLTNTTIKTALASLGASALAACGGVLQLAEIEGSGYSDGTASGYGSVYVNGTRFTTNTAAISVDGTPASEADLEIGMQLQVDGDVLAGVAQQIRYDRDLRGPVDAIDRPNPLSSNATLTVLGQSVMVDSRTRYVGTDLGSLDTDNSIDVSGLRAADGGLRATLVQLRNSLYTAGAERVDVEGVVTAVSGNLVTIGSLQIDLAGTALAGQATNGDRIEAFGQQANRGGVLVADQAQFAPSERNAAGPQVQLDGLVGAVAGDTLSIAGLQVDTSGASRGDTSGLPITTGSRVIIAGTETGATSVSASRLTLLPPADIHLTGSVGSISTVSQQISVLGQTIELLPHTQFIDDSNANLRRFRTADLNVGDTVELLAYQTADNTLAAARLRRIDPVGSITLAGEASNIDAANERLRLAGVLISTRPTTVFTDADGNLETGNQFFANIDNGSLVEAVGSGDGLGGLKADRLMRP